MRNRRLIVISALCVFCFAGSGAWTWHRYRQWSSPESLILRAASAVRDDDLGRAQVLIRNAIRQAPDNVEARIQIANVLNALSKKRRAGDVPAAVEQIAHAAGLSPDDLELQTRLFTGWHYLGRKKSALAVARRVVDLGSDNAMALIYVIDAELDDGNIEAADELLDRLVQVVPADNVAVLARRLSLLEASGDKAQLQVLCDAIVVRLASAGNLATLDPWAVGITPSVIARNIQDAPDGESLERSTRAMRLIRRLLAERPETENQWPLVSLAQQIAATGVTDQESDGQARKALHVEFTDVGRWLLNSKHYPRHLTSGFAVLLYHSALVSGAPEFAVEILPGLIKQRDSGKPLPLTAGQRDSLFSLHATALARVIGTDAESDARAGVERLEKHASTDSLASLLNVLLAVSDGDTDLARQHLAKATEDTGIDPQLILAMRCRCDLQSGNWQELSEALGELELAQLDDRQRALLEILLGPEQRRRLLRATALLELERTDEADQVLDSLRDSDVYALGCLTRILHQVRQGDLVGARKLWGANRANGTATVELVIADAAIVTAAGRPGDVASRMIEHLILYPDDTRVRMLLARWYQATGRTREAVAQYRDVIQINPEHLHAWVMAAVLLQASGQQTELDSLLQGMAATDKVLEYAVRLRRQMASFAIQLRRSRSDPIKARDAVDLLHADDARWSADWNLLLVALRASRADSPLRVISQLEFAVAENNASPRSRDAILDRLEGGLLLALWDVEDADAEEMQRRISELVKQHPGESGPRIAAIVYFANRHDVATAWEHAQALAKIDTVSGRAQFWMARLLAVSYRISEAANQLEASLLLADRPDARLFGARLELFRDQPQKALEHLDRMPATQIRQAVPVLLRFEALRRLDRHEQAAAALTGLLQREPQHVSIWLRLSEHYERESGGQQVIGLVSTALRHHPYHSGLRSKLLTLLVRHDRLDEARTLAVQLAETPDHPETPLSLATTFLTAEAVEEGDAWLKKVDVDHAPPFQYAMAIYQQGMVHKDRGLIERAGGLLEQLANESPDSLPVLNNLAWIMAVDLGRPDAALPIVERMVSLSNPGEFDPTLVDTIAEVLFANGRAADALSIVRKSVLQHPDDGVLRYHSGVLQISLARDAAQTGSALHDLTFARRWTQLSSRRDAYAAAILKQYGSQP